MDMTGDDWVSWRCACSSSKAEDVVDGSVPDVEHGGGANGQDLKLGCLQRSNS